MFEDHVGRLLLLVGTVYRRLAAMDTDLRLAVQGPNGGGGLRVEIHRPGVGLRLEGDLYEPVVVGLGLGVAGGVPDVRGPV